MQSCPLSVSPLGNKYLILSCPSVKIEGVAGGGVNLRNASVTFFGMELLWDDINHILKDRFG